MRKSFKYVIVNHGPINFKWDDLVTPIIEPVLLNKDGLFRIIPAASIKNKFECIGPQDINVKFHWGGAIPVSQAFAGLLLGENVDNKCTYNKKKKE